jgi:hypothetical protein
MDIYRLKTNATLKDHGTDTHQLKNQCYLGKAWDGRPQAKTQWCYLGKAQVGKSLAKTSTTSQKHGQMQTG